MRINWLWLLPVLLGLAMIALAYSIIVTSGADVVDSPGSHMSAEPEITRAEAMRIAQTRYPDMSMENSSAELFRYKSNGTEKLAWSVDVETVPDINSPNCYIAYVTVYESDGTLRQIQYPVSWGGIVTVDATTGEILHVNPAA